MAEINWVFIFEIWAYTVPPIFEENRRMCGNLSFTGKVSNGAQI